MSATGVGGEERGGVTCEMLRNLLESADPAECARYSFDHYHVRGLRYVNLLRTARLTAKLYIVRPGTVELNDDGFLVNPHSHGYNFETLVVTGRMKNVEFGPGHERWHALRYMSPLKGEKRAEPFGEVGLGVRSSLTLRAGERYYLDTDQAHTIWVPTDGLTILFLLQYHDIPRRDTLLFGRRPDMPSLDGLYASMTPEAVAEDLELVRWYTMPRDGRGWVTRLLEPDREDGRGEDEEAE